jgi:hypothetical protein
LAVPSQNTGFAAATAVGDGLIQDETGTLNSFSMFSGETSAFIADLSIAQMLDNNNKQHCFDDNPANAYTTATLSLCLIASPYQGHAGPIPNTGFFVWASAGGSGSSTAALPSSIAQYNYWHLAGLFGLNGGSIIDATAIPPIDAAGIDSKIDDGVPNTGRVLAYNSQFGYLALTVGANECSSAAGKYDVAANPTKGECSLAIQAGF